MADSPADPTAAPSSEPLVGVERDRAVIQAGRQKGPFGTLAAFVKLSGPGWLQSAITLGGGSLGSSLYLGVLGGFGLLWLQPMAMILGIIMLAAIAYVTLSTGKRPYQAIKEHVNPVLAYAWIIATMMANFVWCMPQFALGVGAISQNVAPGVFEQVDETTTKGICVAILFVLAGIVSWFYQSGGRGIKVFEVILKILVGVVVVCFFGVVAQMVFNGSVPFGEVFAGFIPDFSLFTTPAEAFRGPIEATGEFASFWRDNVVLKEQQKVMLTAAGTAVGINMTFLLPYSMLARGWDRDFRGLATFDLSTGLLIPYLLATTCVVVSAASQFHAQQAPGLVDGTVQSGKLFGRYTSLLDKRVAAEVDAEAFAKLSDDEKQAKRDALPMADRQLAAMLVKRDAGNLSGALAPLLGKAMANIVFGIGVFGMAISTIIILMLINGFVFCELFNKPGHAGLHRFGAFAAAVVGAMGPFIWGGEKAQFWLVVPTSMIGYAMLPIAFVAFFLMINNRGLLGDATPTGSKRLVWNTLLGVSLVASVMGSFWAIKTSNSPNVGYTLFAVLIGLALAVHYAKKGPMQGTAGLPVEDEA